MSSFNLDSTILYYFPIKGRGQQIRLALSEAGIKWEEGGGNLSELKQNGIATFGSLPVLVHNGIKITQGTNCASYIAKKYGFGGSNDEEHAEINQFVLAAEDFRSAVVNVWFKKTTVEDFLSTAGAAPRWFGCFNKLLENKEYFCHDKFSIADISVYDAVNLAIENINGITIDEYPYLKAHYERIENRPAIASLKVLKI